MNFGKFKKKSRGAILIEFAFAIPILATVVFFMTDAPRYYYVRSKMKHSTHFTANLIQNITQSNNEKKINTKHLFDVFSSAVMNHYNGLQLYEKNNNSYQLGHTISVYVYYVECTDSQATVKSSENNQAKITWCWHSDHFTQQYKNSTYSYLNSQDKNSIVNFSATTAKDILDGFQIARGDAKIIIEIGLIPTNSAGSGNDKNKEIRRKFGFFMLPIRPKTGTSYFNTTIVFTPKPNLFDEEKPIDFEETK